jgi:hypothetical protein
MVYDLVKSLVLVFTAVLVPIYWQAYGATNFLWFSDIGLFMTNAALLLKSKLLMSMVAVGLLFSELLWNISFFGQLFTGHKILPIASYMFDPQYSWFLRALSLFHVTLPLLWLHFIMNWGYDRRAFKFMIFFMAIVLGITYLYTDPAKNINWVFSPRVFRWQNISAIQWLTLQLIAIVLVALPTHYFLAWLSKATRN